MRVLQNNFIIAVLIAFFGIALFTVGLGNQEIIGFEARFYLFAQEMLRQGPSLFPTTYGRPYPDYTAASTIGIYYFAHLFGYLNKFTAVLPSAIAAALTLSVTYLIASLHNKRLGFAAVMLLLLTITFFKNARLISLDMYPTLMCAACFYLLYAADVLQKPWLVFLSFIFLCLGFIFRGPIGLIMPAAVGVAYFAVGNEWRKVFKFGLVSLLLLIILTISLLLLTKDIYGSEFMHDALRMQIVGRLENHYRPFYFYFVNSLGTYALSYLFAILVLILLVKYKTFPNKNLIFKLLAWVLIIMLGMSLAGDKKTRYILPIAPALALIAAHLFYKATQTYFKKLQQLLVAVLFLLPLVFAVFLEIIYLYDGKYTAHFGIPYLSLTMCLLALQVLNFVIMYRDRDATKQIFPILITLTVAFVLTYIAAIERVILFIERGRALIEAVERERIKQGASLVFYQENPDGFVIKYLIDMPTPASVSFIRDPSKLLTLDHKAFFVTREANFSSLPDAIKAQMQIIAVDKMGHVQVVIFTKK